MTKHRTAPAADIAVETDPPRVSVGLSPVDLAGDPRPDLAGLRMKHPARGEIYVIDPYGRRRWIPDPTTYNNLFRDWSGVVLYADIDDIPEITAITPGAVLARASGTAGVYLVTDRQRRPIPSSAVMDKYHFNWSTVVEVPHGLLESIRVGNVWS